MRFNKNMIVRVVALVVVLINQIMIGFGFEPLPFDEQQVYEGMSTVATVVIAIVTTYFDTDVTKKARRNEKILKQEGLK